MITVALLPFNGCAMWGHPCFLWGCDLQNTHLGRPILPATASLHS